VTQCNCSICAKLGALWAYYPPDALEITRGDDVLVPCRWGDELIDIRFCGTCGCTMHWRARAGREHECFPEGTPRKLGVNARLIDDLDATGLPIRLVDGASR
jgi:hypothetical protein